MHRRKNGAFYIYIYIHTQLQKLEPSYHCQSGFLSLLFCCCFVCFHLKEALYFEKGNKHLLVAFLNPLGRDNLLYNGFKLCYLELEESVKQWGNTKLLMKTSLIGKEQEGWQRKRRIPK